MIRAKYKCGYCNSEFEQSFFNEQEIPERNVGCTYCRIAGEKVRLIKKVRDERGIKKTKTSNLLYPITVLESERDNVPHQPGSLIAQLNKAIDILNDQKGRDEKVKRYFRQIEMRSGIADNKNIKI
ncbi:hypothetical protein ES705_38317 [subsurface metagenome]